MNWQKNIEHFLSFSFCFLKLWFNFRKHYRKKTKTSQYIHRKTRHENEKQVKPQKMGERITEESEGQGQEVM